MSTPARVRFVVVGEALIDLVPQARADGACLARPGGSPLNVAVGLARLGQPTALAARLSRDPFGTVLRRYLQYSAVDASYLVPAAEPTTIALVELAGGDARYQFSAGGADFRWTAAELEFLPGSASAVHFGSLASWMPPGAGPISAAVRRLRAEGRILLSYDPNVRPGLQPDPGTARDQVERSVGLAHVVKASADDLRWLYPRQDHGAVARHWLDLGADLIVVTAGGDGATAWTRPGLMLRRPASPAQVCDTVGAGDAFTSGLLDALARRGLLDPARLEANLDAAALAGMLDEAGLVAGITCSRPGANPPWRAELGPQPPG